MTRFTADTKTPAINITCWFLLVVATIGVLTRLGTKIWIFRKLTKDDYLIIVSTIFDISQGVALSIATENGYGFHLDTLNDTQLTTIMKSQYAQQMLTIASLACSKISFIMFVKSITANPLDIKIAGGLLVVISIWGVGSLITVAFQCPPLSTWDYLKGKCYNIKAWENFFCISNIVTEMATIGYTFSIIARIHTRLGRKIGIACVFGLRLLVVAAIIGETVLLNRSLDSPDVTYTTWAVDITNQLILCLSLITACSAQFKPFLDSLQSSGMRLDGLMSTSREQTQKYPNYGRHSSGASHSASKSLSINLRSLTSRGKNYAHNHHGHYVETVVTASPVDSPDWDGTSQTSQSRIIRQTRTWTVTAECHGAVEQEDDA